MQISVLSQQRNNQYSFQKQVFQTAAVFGSSTDKADQSSGLAAIATSYGLTDVSLQGDQVSWGYRKDGSLALHATSSYNVSLHQQDVQVEIALSADALGGNLSPSLFKNGPVEFNLNYQFKSADVTTFSQARVVKTTRTPDEILRSLMKALRDALSHPGDKSLSLEFDEEAVKSLMGDPEMSKAISALLSLMMVINAIAAQNKAKDHYTIAVSGKGEPYLDVSSQTNAAIAETNVQIHVVITPPAVEAATN